MQNRIVPKGGGLAKVKPTTCQGFDFGKRSCIVDLKLILEAPDH